MHLVLILNLSPFLKGLLIFEKQMNWFDPTVFRSCRELQDQGFESKRLPVFEMRYLATHADATENGENKRTRERIHADSDFFGVAFMLAEIQLEGDRAAESKGLK